jgi:hypothetical protein
MGGDEIAASTVKQMSGKNNEVNDDGQFVNRPSHDFDYYYYRGLT